MNYRPLISIITPCYNSSRFIADTIKSVQLQTYDEWEMIIVDDASTDNSISIVDDIKEKDSRIRLVKLPINTGSPSTPRNRGIQESKGEIIAFLDADDTWMPDKLETQLNYLQERGADIVYTNGVMIDENNNYIRTMIKVHSVDYHQTLKHDELSCSSVMVRKALIHGCFFKKQMMEDYIFWLQVLKKTGAKAYNVNRILYSYRLVANSRSRNKKLIIKRQWEILRHVEKLSLLYATYCFMNYLFINIKKYYLSK